MNKARRIKIEKAICDLDEILEQVIFAEEEESNRFDLMCLENAKFNLKMALNNLESSAKRYRMRAKEEF